MTFSPISRLVSRGVIFLLAALMASAPLRAEENRAALDAFLKQMQEFDAGAEALAAKLLKTPGGGVVLIRTIAERTKAIKTDGLPADLQAAFADYVAQAQALAAVFKGWPEKPEDVVAFIQAEQGKNPNFLREGEAKNASAIQDMQKAIAKLDETGRKYGLEGLASLTQ